MQIPVPALLLVLGLAAVVNGVFFEKYDDAAKVAKNATNPPEVEEEQTQTTVTSVDNSTLSANSTESEDDCYDQIGTVQNGVPENTMPKYDVEKILEDLGGAPGAVNATRLDGNGTLELALSDEESKRRPLPDIDDPEFWLYDYKTSDYKSFIRREHALLRFNGTEQEFVDVRGEIWWTPPDFCGYLRYATYRQDDTGFHADVDLRYCRLWLEQGTLWCAAPAVCHTMGTQQMCVAAPSTALLASLVG